MIPSVEKILPRYIVLKSITFNKYMRYIQEDGEVHGLLKFDGEEMVSPYTKLEVERAKAGKGLVHLRCVYNNKNLVRWTYHHWWLAANADEPEEDTSKWSCTLFEPSFGILGESNYVAFKHVQLPHYAGVMPMNEPYDNCFFAGESDPITNDKNVFAFVDWESLMMIPKNVAFLGSNRKFLCTRRVGMWISFLQFDANENGDQTAGFQIFPQPDGTIRIYSNFNRKFWRRLHKVNYIWAYTENETVCYEDTLFWPVKVSDNVLALRCLGNMFCQGQKVEDSKNVLVAGSSTISIEDRFEVHELVISSNIYNVKFRLADAKIYDQVPTIMATQPAANSVRIYPAPDPTPMALIPLVGSP